MQGKGKQGWEDERKLRGGKREGMWPLLWLRVDPEATEVASALEDRSRIGEAHNAQETEEHY